MDRILFIHDLRLARHAFAGLHNIPDANTIEQRGAVAARRGDRRFSYRDLIVPNGRASDPRAAA